MLQLMHIYTICRTLPSVITRKTEPTACCMRACVSTTCSKTVASKINNCVHACLQGKLQAAMVPFEEAIQLVSFRSRVGGEATLQKAICLDSLVGSPMSLGGSDLSPYCSVSLMLSVADGHAREE